MLKNSEKGLKRERVKEAEEFRVNENGGHGISQQLGSIFLVKF